MPPRSLECLMKDVAFALHRGLGPDHLVPMLERLLSVAPNGSEACQFGRLQLAELMIHSRPFRAASLARSVAVQSASDRAWSVVGLSLTVMGHYRSAIRAFRVAHSLAPEHPGHLHNLGHVMDVGLGHSAPAVKYLEQAHARDPEIREIASSLAHAVSRCGQTGRAVELLVTRVGMSSAEAHQTIELWRSAAQVSRCQTES